MEGSGSFVSLLRPVLDTYMDASVGLVGCRSAGLDRESCEHDLLVLRQERDNPATLRTGNGFIDIVFATERELLDPGSAEVSVSLAFMKPIRDLDLVLSTCASSARESLQRNYQRSAAERTASSVKAMGRAEEALSLGGRADADFWLTAAGYDFAFAWLLSSSINPAPSHLLAQLRRVSPTGTGLFEAFSGAVGLRGASRAACEARIEALGIVFDLKETQANKHPSASRESVRASYELLRAKSMETLRASQPADCYCFLGLEAVRSLPTVSPDRPGRREASGSSSPLSSGGSPLLADSVVKALGLARPAEALEKSLEALRERVSSLARRT